MKMTLLLSAAMTAASVCANAAFALKPAMWADVPDVAPLRVGDMYYLEYAAGGVPEHWAYSTAKSIHGSWTYGGKIMDCAEGTGTIHGGSVFFKGEWYMLYHNATLEYWNSVGEYAVTTYTHILLWNNMY